MSLANKYRPTKLSDVIGQNTVVTALSNQLENNTVSQALLFCGPAGTGKTTVARIIANSLNAEIHELDAASNNGIDNVRMMQEQAKAKSITNENKVFILDEFHAMSGASFQALLKVLEEPPKNVYFILCTTETNKIPKTIMSRVQKYFFNSISADLIVKHLTDVCDIEGIECSTDAMNFIAEKSGGCMRDALSMLDAASSYSANITLRSCIDALNEVTPAYIQDFVEALENKYLNQAVRIVTDVDADGFGVKQFIANCISHTVKISVIRIKDGLDLGNLPDILEWLINIKKDLAVEETPVEFVEANIIIWCKG
jgi:DNA polymerase-3 subunit gamma/tau